MELQSDWLHFLLYWIVSGLAVLLTSKLIRGFEVKSFWAACLAAFVLGIVNTLIWPVLVFLTLPLTILTLGLFIFVVNGIVLKICAAVVPGFEIRSWWTAIFGSIVLSVISWLLHAMIY